VGGYLVFFVSDPVDDSLAAEVRGEVAALARRRAWSARSPGFFDDPEPEPGSARTTGGFLRLDGPAADDVAALFDAVVGLSARLEVACELQWREAILGHVRAGVADPGLEQAVTSATATG